MEINALNPLIEWRSELYYLRRPTIILKPGRMPKKIKRTTNIPKPIQNLVLLSMLVSIVKLPQKISAIRPKMIRRKIRRISRMVPMDKSTPFGKRN